MIKRLQESHGTSLGFEIVGNLTTDDVASLSQQIDVTNTNDKKHIGLLADLTHMEGADWNARWGEMRFLQRHSAKIARLAVICDDDWEEIKEMVVVATAVLQAQTLYFHSSEILHAWHWVKMNKLDEAMPVRIMYPGRGLFQDYSPEYMGI
jgi:hypothetical protein